MVVGDWLVVFEVMKMEYSLIVVCVGCVVEVMVWFGD